MDELVCRLCLQTITSNNCQAVEEFLSKSLKLNLKISKENVMCIECANCLRVFSNFAPGHAYMGDETLPLPSLDNGIKLDPEPIETTSNPKSLLETKVKCSFCTKTRGREDLISLRISKANKFLVDMLEQYISEMNLKTTEEFLTCDTCLEALEGVSSVISKCLEVEERISKYIALKGKDDKGQVELKKVQEFMFRPTIKLESESFGIIKLERKCDQIQEEHTTTADTEMKDEKQISNTELTIKTEGDGISSERNNCDIIKIKSEQSDCDGFLEPLVMSETRKSNNPIKQYKHKNPSKISTFKCEICSYETKHKNCLNSHLLIHKSPSELQMFGCELCTYETKRKCDLKDHLLIHKSPSEIKMFKCEICPYKAKRRHHLKRHSLTHKSPSEIQMFKCEFCPYEAKLKIRLNVHLLIHKSPSEIKMFKCASCTYETKQKRDLKNHLVTHKSPSELKMFKCKFCSYEAKLKSRLNAHLLIHKSSSQIKMFKCESCTYETKHKRDFKHHLVTHKSPSEIKMFKCEFCSYEAKLKSLLNAHLLVHKSPSQIKMFKCEICPYEAKKKNCLDRHLLTHKSPSEIRMFKCALCSYEAKQKCTLKTHLFTHKSPSGLQP